MRGGRSKAQDPIIKSSAAGGDSAFEGRGSVFSLQKTNPAEVDGAEVADCENPVCMGGGKLDMHTKPEIR